jgi:hypothetical protein
MNYRGLSPIIPIIRSPIIPTPLMRYVANYEGNPVELSDEKKWWNKPRLLSLLCLPSLCHRARMVNNMEFKN